MKKAVMFFVLCFIFVFSSEITAQVIFEKTFTIENNTGFMIYDCYVSSVDTEEWEEDVLGVEVLNDGESLEITFEVSAEEDCNWDIKIGDQEDNYWVLYDVDICSNDVLTFTSENKITAEVEE